MTKNELEQYENLNDKFYSACNHYCAAMSKYDSDYLEIDTFSLCNGVVEGTGYNDDDEKEYSVQFPIEHLLMDDDELSTYIDTLIYHRKKFHKEALEEYHKQQEEDRKLHERIKASFYEK